MKTITLLIIIILMLVIVGCSETNTQQQNTEQQPFVGGGCGVQGSDSDGDMNQLPMEGNL